MPAFKPIAERFWPKVDTSGGADACWPWLASVNVARQGYGQFQVSVGVIRGAHRVENIRRTSRPTCKRGHPRTPEHLRIKRDGRRDCRTCRAIRDQEKRAAA